jgi:hypothetical protein
VARLAKAEADCAALEWTRHLLPEGLSDEGTRVALRRSRQQCLGAQRRRLRVVQHALRSVSGHLMRQRRAAALARRCARPMGHGHDHTAPRADMDGRARLALTCARRRGREQACSLWLGIHDRTRAGLAPARSLGPAAAGMAATACACIACGETLSCRHAAHTV